MMTEQKHPNMAKVIQVSSRVTEVDMKEARRMADRQKPALVVHSEKRQGQPPPRAISDPDTLIMSMELNPFVYAFERAYSGHMALRLKPDDVWLTIAQGVAAHINAPGNGEKFRHKFVAHEGKKELVVIQNGGPYWDKFAEDCVSMAEGHMVDTTLVQALCCDFTTTTPAANIAARIVTMNALKTYFEYTMMCMCGIPTVIMEGTLEDWQRIIDKVHQIESLDLGLEWWLDELKPVLHQLLKTYKGEADEDFWSRVITRKPGGSGIQPSLTGWVVVFFPYAIDEKYKREPVTGKLGVNHVPPGLQSVEIKFLATPSSPPETLNLEAGFLGCRINAEEGSIAPHIGWMVTDPPPPREDRDSEW